MTFLARGRLRQLAHGDHFGPALDQLLHLQPDLAQIDVQVLQHVGRDAAAFLDQPQQDVLGADVFVVEPLRLLVGQLHDFAGAVGKSLVHVFCSSWLPSPGRRRSGRVRRWVRRRPDTVLLQAGEQSPFLSRFPRPLRRAVQPFQPGQPLFRLLDPPRVPIERRQQQVGVYISIVLAEQP